MKNDVGPKIDHEFDKMEKHYLSCAKRSYTDLERQMEKVKRIFIKKYETIIAKRIKESDAKEKELNSRLDLLKNNLAIVSQLNI